MCSVYFVSGAKKFLLVFVVVLLSSLSFADANKPPTKKVDNTTLTGKVMCGYQGWFGCPNDGSHCGWSHYGYGQKFKPGNCVIDLWPDVSEFDNDEKYQLRSDMPMAMLLMFSALITKRPSCVISNGCSSTALTVFSSSGSQLHYSRKIPAISTIPFWGTAKKQPPFMAEPMLSCMT